MFNEYRFSGSLPENATTYVTREADKELYELLKDGKFCYVLNSRQSGKSSIRVRTMRRLRSVGIECAAIDLSAGGVQNVTPEQWYVDLIDNLIESFALDVNLAQWWQKNQLQSEVTRFRKFIEEVLLVEVQAKIVIFIDEIDSVLSLKFPTDDFFALIRACHNQRVDNINYNRLTFCLLGVASPTNLIQDKQRTPFNIGKAINLKGFQLHEVGPLRKGLEEKFADSQAVMQEILNWTGGQPFLTQKLCQFMVEEAEKDNPRSVGQVVRARIIENWELQDEPEHLRTIRSRILRNEEQAGYLLELYQQVHLHGEVVNNDSVEQSELLLSGLVGKQQNELKVYNLIYQEVFNQNWVEAELKKLRPYSEAFRGWVASGCIDESRLLRGNTLKDAEEWGKDKNLSYQDKQFLAASREKEIQEEIIAREKEAQLERERKDREAAEQRNQVLSQANKKAKQQIRIGSFVLIFALSFAAISTFVAAKKVEEVSSSNEYLGTVEKLAQLAGQLEEEGSDSEAKELFSQAGQSVNIKDHKLRQAVLYAGISYAYQKLKSKDFKLAQNYLDKSKKQWKNLLKDNSHEALQIRVLTSKTKANLFKEQGNSQQAISAYQEAYNIFNNLKEKGKRGKKIVNISPPFNSNIKIKILSKQNIETLHREFIALLLKNANKNLKSEVDESLKEHYLDELNNLLANKKWQEADNLTARFMLYVANREEEGYFDTHSLKNFSCQRLQDIDSLWVQNSDERFGFSVQKRIWIEEGNRLGITEFTPKDEKAYIRYVSRIGWYDGKEFLSYVNLMKRVEGYKVYGYRYNGILPIPNYGYSIPLSPSQEVHVLLFSRCDL
jgi:hypothetical protein